MKMMTLVILTIFKPQSLFHHQLRLKVKLLVLRLKMGSVQVYQSQILAWLRRVASSKKSLLIAAGQMSISSQVQYAQIITIMSKVPLMPQRGRNLSGIMIGPKTTKIKIKCRSKKMQIMGLMIVMNSETLMSGREEMSHQRPKKKKNKAKLRMTLVTLLQTTIQKQMSKKVPVLK